MRVLLVSEAGESRHYYEDALTRREVAYDIAGDLKQMHERLLIKPYSGLLIDVPTLIRASSREKTLVQDYVDLYPSLRLCWDPEEKRVRSLYYGPEEGGGDSLDEFLEASATPFSPRVIRDAARRDVVFNVVLARDREELLGSGTRSVTMNVSPGGCFVVTTDDWRQGEEIWLKLADIDDAEPLKGKVRWMVPWGETLRMPGIGVEFTRPDESHRASIAKLLQKG